MGELRYFNSFDFFLFPAFVLFFYAIVRNKANKQSSLEVKRIYYRAYFFKVIMVIGFLGLTQFYFNGGDTDLYYQAIKDMRAAIDYSFFNVFEIFKSDKLLQDSPLFSFFFYDNNSRDLTYSYMTIASNFMTPKFAVIPSYLMFNSYICLCLYFGFFSYGGAIRLFKFFYEYFPQYYREIAFSCLFCQVYVFGVVGY